jgi:hypothetical protein
MPEFGSKDGRESSSSLEYSPLAGRKEGFPLTDVVPGSDPEALEDRSRKPGV